MKLLGAAAATILIGGARAASCQLPTDHQVENIEFDPEWPHQPEGCDLGKDIDAADPATECRVRCVQG